MTEQPHHEAHTTNHTTDAGNVRPLHGRTDDLTTIPPQDLEAEQAALGAMLLTGPDQARYITEVTSLIEAGDYYRPAHATIHAAILAMRERGDHVDPILLAHELDRTGDLTRIGGATYLHTLVQLTPTAANGAYYAAIVAERAAERRILETTLRAGQQVRAGDTEAARIAADAAAELATIRTAERWPDPVPLGAHGELPAFPVDTFPAWIGEHVSAVAEFTQTPPDLAATMALAALSTAAGGRVHVQVRPGWREQTNLYLVCAMPPASRKSDVFAAMTAPVYALEDQLKEQSRAAIIEAETAKETAQAEVEALLTKARKAGDSVAREQLVAEASAAKMAAEDIHVPHPPRLTVSDDITPEPLAAQLAIHRCLAALSPEGDLFDHIAGRYSAKPNLGVFLKAHKGERLQTDRITRTQPQVDKPALTIGVTPQPSVLHDLADTPQARDRGLLARFLYALPASNLGYRKPRGTSIPAAVDAAYTSRLTTLLRTLTALPEPVTIPLTEQADRAIEALQTDLEPKLRPDAPLAHLTDWAGKLIGATARIAGLIHLADHIGDDGRWGEPIGPEPVKRATAIADYYTAHALAVFDLIGTDPATQDAQLILNWLRRPKADGTHRRTVKRRDAVTASRRFRSVTQVDPALALLEAHGYLRADEPERTGHRGRPASVTYRVHPSLHTPEDGADAR